MRATLFALSAASVLFGSSVAAQQAASPRPYTEGPIMVISYIKTKPGMFNRYMEYLNGPYKANMEAQKSAGIVADYMILTSEARTPADHDVMLAVNYRNWAALDNLADRSDAVVNRVLQSSPQQRDQQFVDRGAMREVLGYRTYQRLMLK